MDVTSVMWSGQVTEEAANKNRSQLVKLSDVQENSKSKALPGNGPSTLKDSEESCG